MCERVHVNIHEKSSAGIYKNVHQAMYKRPLFYIILGTLALFLGMPNPILHIPFLVLVYPASLYLIALYSSSPFRHGMWCGLLGVSASMYFISITMHVYGNLPYILAVPCTMVFGAYFGLWTGLFSFMMKKTFVLNPFLRALFAGLFWYICEWVRAYLFTGFPWLSISSAFVAIPTFIQGASVLGAFGLSGVFVMISVLLVESFGLHTQNNLYNFQEITQNLTHNIASNDLEKSSMSLPQASFLSRSTSSQFLLSFGGIILLACLYAYGHVRLLSAEFAGYEELYFSEVDRHANHYKKQYEDPSFISTASHILVLPKLAQEEKGDNDEKKEGDAIIDVREQALLQEHNLVYFTAVQGNVSQAIKWDQAFQVDTVNKYIRLSEEGLAFSDRFFSGDKGTLNAINFVKNTISSEQYIRSPKIVLWPETAMPFYFQTDSPLSYQIRNFAASSYIDSTGHIIANESNNEEINQTVGARKLIFGGAGLELAFREEFLREMSMKLVREGIVADNNLVDFEALKTIANAKPFIYNPEIHSVENYYNRLFFLDGERLSYYDKEHLVPFGEYMPQLPFLPNLFPELLQGLSVFVAGWDQSLFSLEDDNERLFSALICYEAIFPQMARDDVAMGSQLFVNVSNDAWYEKTSASMQHLYLSAMRSVEQGRFLVRAGNTGISAFVDNYGRIMGQTHIFEDASISAFVLLRTEKTIFYHLSPYLPFIAIALLILLWIRIGILRRIYSLKK